MAAIAGKDGKVMVGGNQVAETTNWSLDIGTDTIDTTAHGDEWRKFIAGLKNWSATIEANWDMSDVNGQKALQDALLGGTKVTLQLYVGSNYYSGEAYITRISVGVPVGDKVSVTFEAQGTGQLTYT